MFPPYPVRLAMLLGWMGMIFVFSADSDSGQTSGGLLEVLLSILAGILSPLEPGERDLVHLLIRKGAHFTEYAVLAMLWTGVLPRGSRRFMLAFFLATGYAITDEIHQAFVPSRGPSPIDVLIDASGATLALALLWLSKRVTWAPRRTS